MSKPGAISGGWNMKILSLYKNKKCSIIIKDSRSRAARLCGRDPALQPGMFTPGSDGNKRIIMRQPKKGGIKLEPEH